MLEWLKSAWARWRVQVSVVGGVVVIATAFGTCSFDPQEVSEATVVPVEVNVETAPVSETTETENTTTTTNVESGGETTETTATE